MSWRCLAPAGLDDELFGDTVDTLKEVIEQHGKRECLKGAIGKCKVYLLGGKQKWRQEKVHKASDETINKTYAEYKQCELNEKGEKIRKALGKHVISLYSTGISHMVKIRYVEKLQQDTEHDPIIKDQIQLRLYLVCTFGTFLAPVCCAYSEQLRSWPWTRFWKWGLWKLLKKLLLRIFCIWRPDTKLFWSK